MATYRKFRDIDYGKPIIAPTHGDTVAPQNDLAAAAWLPISATNSDINPDNGYFTYDYQRHVFTDKVVIMPGKLVALTRESLTGDNSMSSINQGTVGRLVPAGIRLAWKAAEDGDNILEYTWEDEAERIEDLTTGLPVTGTSKEQSIEKRYEKGEVTAALKARGLIRANETCADFISRPIGVAANVVYAWAGGDGTQPKGLRFMNYRRENKSTFWTGQDHTLRLPVCPCMVGTQTVPAISGHLAADIDAIEGATGTGTSPSWFLGASAAAFTATLGVRYSDLPATATQWVGLVLGHKAIESNIYNPLVVKTSAGADKTATVLKSEKGSLGSVKKAGDWFLDRALGILFLHSDNGLTLTGSGLVAGDTVTMSFLPTLFVDAGMPRKVFAAVGAAVNPGDYLSYDKYSNFVPYIARPDETDDANGGSVDTVATAFHRPEDIVGKCYTLDRSPKADLATVKTFHDYEGVSLADRTPGSANDGHPAEIHQSLGGQFAAIVRVLL
jgi:hypothetical protein